MNNNIIEGFDDLKSDDLTIRLERLEQVPEGLAIGLVGRLDTFSHVFFERQVKRVFEAGYRRLAVDIADLYYASSAGVGSLFELQRNARGRGGDLVLVKMTARVFTIVELLGFARFFKLVDSRDEAVRRLALPAPDPRYPRVFACPVCDVKLRAGRAGRFRCAHCRTVLALADTGAVALA